MATIPQKKKPNPFTKSIDGVFGRFRTKDSYDLYYLMATFHVTDLDDIVTAVDALPFDAIGFEELVQRDIDYERVNQKIVKEYLERGRDRVIFFPPLLITPLIIENSKPKDTYDDFSDTIYENEDGQKQYEAIWDTDKFKLELNLQETASSHEIQCKADKSKHFFIHYAATVRYNPKTVKLVTIDGQHRLVALKEIIRRGQGELIQNAEIPVCLFFSPNAASKAPGNESLLKDMRELFVTINSTSRQVSGHFIVLLNDRSLSAMCVRELANFWKDSHADAAKSALQMLEWNQRLDSRSSQLNRPYSVTTVSIVSEALKTFAFDSKRGATQTLLNVAEVVADLNLPQAPVADAISETTFVGAQVPTIKTQIKKYITPALDILFRKPVPYAILRDNYGKALTWLDGALNMQGTLAFRQNVLCQFRDCQAHDLPLLREVETVFNKTASSDDDIEFYRTNVFQSGLLAAWVDLCKELCPTIGLKPPQVAELLVEGLAQLCFNPAKNVFDPKRDYVQNVIFRGKDIVVNSTSKRQTGNLILSTLLCEPCLEAFVQRAGKIRPSKASQVRRSIEEASRLAIDDFITTFEQSTQKHIARNYHFTGLPEETVRRLDACKGTADSKKSREFEQIVESLAMSAREKALRVLANVLNVKVSFLFADKNDRVQI